MFGDSGGIISLQPRQGWTNMDFQNFVSVTVYELCVEFISESAVQKHKEDSLTASENFLRFRPDSESKCLDNPDDQCYQQ